MNSTTTFEYTDSPFLGRHNTAVSKADLLEGDFELTQFKLAAPSDRTQEIREIIQDGKVAELKDYLSENRNVKLINDLDDHGFSLLHLSARWNRVEMTRILIDHGAEVDIRLKNSSTPLHVAARFNCPEVAEVLLSSGARPSLVDSLNNNALHHAVRRRNKEMVYMLVRDTDIDVNAKTQVGLTALHLVCINGDKEICQTLLRHGADITAKTAELSTPLQVAIFSCNTSLAEMLIKQASSQLLDVKEFLNEPDVDQDCALHLAAESRNVKSVELCLKYGANVNAQRSSLMTPLHIAAMRGDLEIVKILCGKGADIHIKDNEKKTSLHRAAYENRAEVIKFLISLGAPLDSKANDNRTPFLEAVVAGSVESARLLLDSGADAFASTSEMKNCLHLAVDNGHLEMVQLLLENKKAKENLYKSDTFERVPLHNAAIYPDI